MLNTTFGRGQWALIQHAVTQMGEILAYDGSLYVRGCFIARAMGEHKYHPNNPLTSWATVYESAKSDERKEFKRMIQYARQNLTIGYILIYSYDRFSRSGANASFLAEELNMQGITLIAVTQKVDTSNAGGKMQQDFFFLLSRFDNEMRRDKTKTGMMELLRKGYWLWTPPRGYKNLNKHHRAVDWDIIITDEGELLRKAFQWRVKNTFSSAEIVRKLNLLGMNINV